MKNLLILISLFLNVVKYWDLQPMANVKLNIYVNKNFENSVITNAWAFLF